MSLQDIEERLEEIESKLDDIDSKIISWWQLFGAMGIGLFLFAYGNTIWSFIKGIFVLIISLISSLLAT